MKVNVEKQPKSTLKLTVTVPKEDVKAVYEEVVTETVKNADIQGFRKGNAPREVVLEKIGTDKIKGDTINRVLQKYYSQAVKENHISPISNPKVEIQEFDLEKDFEFIAVIAIRPEIKVGDYKPKLKERYEEKLKNAKKDLEETNKEKLAKGEKLEEPHVHLGTNDVFEIILSVSEVEVPDILVEEETDRMMSRLIDQTQNLGMSVDQYLKAQNKTSEELRNEYRGVAEKSIKTEFILGQLVSDEKIEVSDSEIDDAFKASGLKEAEERMSDPMERLYVKSILQKNKLLTKLMEEAEGENKHEH